MLIIKVDDVIMMSKRKKILIRSEYINVSMKPTNSTQTHTHTPQTHTEFTCISDCISELHSQGQLEFSIAVLYFKRCQH